MAITPLEQTLIDNARSHQEALATYYPKYQAGPFNEDDHADYLKHSGALTELVSLTHFKSGLSDEAAEQLRQIDADGIKTFNLHFPVEAKPAERLQTDQGVNLAVEGQRGEISRPLAMTSHRLPMPVIPGSPLPVALSLEAIIQTGIYRLPDGRMVKAMLRMSSDKPDRYMIYSADGRLRRERVVTEDGTFERDYVNEGYESIFRRVDAPSS